MASVETALTPSADNGRPLGEHGVEIAGHRRKSGLEGEPGGEPLGDVR